MIALIIVFGYIAGWLLSARVGLWAIKRSDRLQKELNFRYKDGQWLGLGEFDYSKRHYPWVPKRVPGYAIGWALLFPLLAPITLLVGTGWLVYHGAYRAVASPLPSPLSTRRLNKARTAAEITENIARLEKELGLE